MPHKTILAALLCLGLAAEAAAQTYFAKSAKDLDVAEAAMIAGIPNAPSEFDPYSQATAANAVTGMNLHAFPFAVE